MDESALRVSSHLFIVRVWLEEANTGGSEWRGKIQHVPSGETSYFREWPALIELMSSILAAAEPGSDQPGSGGRKKE